MVKSAVMNPSVNLCIKGSQWRVCFDYRVQCNRAVRLLPHGRGDGHKLTVIIVATEKKNPKALGGCTKV